MRVVSFREGLNAGVDAWSYPFIYPIDYEWPRLSPSSSDSEKWTSNMSQSSLYRLTIFCSIICSLWWAEMDPFSTGSSFAAKVGAGATINYQRIFEFIWGFDKDYRFKGLVLKYDPYPVVVGILLRPVRFTLRDVLVVISVRLYLGWPMIWRTQIFRLNVFIWMAPWLLLRSQLGKYMACENSNGFVGLDWDLISLSGK